MTRATTRIALSFKDRLRDRRRSLLAGLRLRFGGFCHHAIQRYLELEAHSAVSKRPRLTADDIEGLKDHQVREVDNSWERRSRGIITDDNLHSGRDQYTEIAARMVRLIEEQGIKSVVNVGSRVDTSAAYLAKRYPGVRFVSVDIQDNLEEHNSLLERSPNWSLVSGYALDLFERGELDGEAVIFSSTACLFTNRELRLYLDAIKARFLLFNEPHALSLRGLSPVRNPDALDPKVSSVSSLSPLLLGGVSFFVHNYCRILEEHGYRVLESEVTMAANASKYRPRHVVLAERTGWSGGG